MKRQLKKGDAKKGKYLYFICNTILKKKIHLVLYTFLHHPTKNPNISLQRQIIRDITEIPQMGK